MNTRHIATYTYMQHVDTHTHRKRINQNFFIKRQATVKSRRKRFIYWGCIGKRDRYRDPVIPKSLFRVLTWGLDLNRGFRKFWCVVDPSLSQLQLSWHGVWQVAGAVWNLFLGHKLCTQTPAFSLPWYENPAEISMPWAIASAVW